MRLRRKSGGERRPDARPSDLPPPRRWPDPASEEVQQEEANSAGRATWKGFVSVIDGFPRILSAVEEPEDGKAPERSCMRLFPAELEP